MMKVFGKRLPLTTGQPRGLNSLKRLILTSNNNRLVTKPCIGPTFGRAKIIGNKLCATRKGHALTGATFPAPAEGWWPSATLGPPLAKCDHGEKGRGKNPDGGGGGRRRTHRKPFSKILIIWYQMIGALRAHHIWRLPWATVAGHSSLGAAELEHLGQDFLQNVGMTDIQTENSFIR